MFQTVSMIMTLAAGFIALALSLVTDEKTRLRLIGIAGGIAFGIGIIFYGYGYSACFGISFVSVVRALLALCRMLSGANDLASINDAPLMQYPAALAVFWFGHFCAYYVTAGAVIMRFGEKMLRGIRVCRLRRGPLLLICGANAYSIAFASCMKRDNKYSVLFVDKNCGTTEEKSIREMGAVLERGEDEERHISLFLRRIGMKRRNRQLLAAALLPDRRRNLIWASALWDALGELKVDPSRATLLLCGAEDEAASLQEKDGRGFGNVYAFDSYYLTARMLITAAPPWEMVSFDDTGRAEMTFRCVVVGFGRMGRAMLSQLLMNGQFVGSRFTADVFDPCAENGMLSESEILSDYTVTFHESGGKSKAFYAFLREHPKEICCIAICTGSREEDEEIAEDLLDWYRPRGVLPTLFLASKEHAAFYGPDGKKRDLGGIYESVVPNFRKIDAAAMRLNNMYVGAAEDEAASTWRSCDYFSRMSTRAATDFAPAYLRMSGKTDEQVLAGDWPPPPVMLETLAETEYMRWCAFHRVFGYRRMEEEEFEARGEQYRHEIAKTGHSNLRIAKNNENRTHACLISWDELDDLSARENAITGENKDYKEYDRNNVRMLPATLKALRGNEETQDGSSL